MKNRGSILILTNLVGINLRNINTKFEEIKRRSQKTKKVQADNDNNNDGHWVIASHPHLFSVTKNLSSTHVCEGDQLHLW